MEGIGSLCCLPVSKNSNNGVTRWVRSMALVSLPPEDCSPSVPLHSSSYWLSWRVLSLLCCCQEVGQSVLGHWLPGAALSAAWEKAASLQQGSVLSGGRGGPLFWEVVCFVLSTIFLSGYILHGDCGRAWGKALPPYAEVWIGYVIAGCASLCAFDFSKSFGDPIDRPE